MYFESLEFDEGSRNKKMKVMIVRGRWVFGLLGIIFNEVCRRHVKMGLFLGNQGDIREMKEMIIVMV